MVYSRNIFKVELIHFAIGFVLGFLPATLIVGIPVILFKELHYDPWQYESVRWLWQMKFRTYCWGPNHQWITMQEKGWLDLFCYALGIVIGLVFIYFVTQAVCSPDLDAAYEYLIQ